MQPARSSPVFALRAQPRRVHVASSDAVTAVAASGGLLWIGTSAGRLLRLDTHTNELEQVRGRLGVGRLDNAVWRIYADPATHAALVILRNADGYHALASGPVRPRWLARLRGLRCVSATWLRLPSAPAPTNVALLGTAFGKLFSLTIDDKYEKNDILSNLWSAPNAEKIDGIRVEYVAGKFVGTVATTSALYLFSDALTLDTLFDDRHITVVNRADPTPHPAPDQQDLLLPSELQFMTGNSGLASRRFVWAAAPGVTHAQLAVRRRRDTRRSGSEADLTARPRSTVIASVIDKDTISWPKLKHTTGSAVPLAVNLSAFHVLVLYPATVYAFNHISGQLTQTVTLWSPNAVPAAPEPAPDWPLARRRVPPSTDLSVSPRTRDTKRQSLGWEERRQYLSSPAAGFARDVLTDALWVYTEDGEFATLVSSNEEQTEAWKAAKAMGRFDLAMALAPLVSSGMPDDTTVFQTREAVLEAQADHAAAAGNWDVAAQLYAKTNRPIETVILDIVKASATTSSNDESALHALGIGSRLRTTKHIITYLVRKLDRMDSSKPMQRTIIATLLVQLYASQLSSETDPTLREDVRKDFGHFLADRHSDLDTTTALGVLMRNGCYQEAWDLAVLSGEVLSASELSSRRGEIDQTLSLLKNQTVVADRDMLSQLISSMSNSLIPQAPNKVTAAMSRSLKKESHHVDHITVVQGLARVAREVKNQSKSRDAYQSAIAYLFDLLHDWKTDVGQPSSSDTSVADDDAPRDWYTLVTFLFQLHAEFGTETEAQRSYDHLVAPHVKKGMSKETTDTLGAMLRSARSAGFRRLCVFLYQALGLHQTAISEAVAIDVKLAESKVAQLGLSDMPENLKNSLWCLVASQSDDPVGVVERSKGVLHIEDVLTHMPQFESATERVKAAVANSLEEHKRLANSAKSDASSALEVTSCMREDLEKARAWQHERHVQRHRHRSRAFSCGHKTKAVARSPAESRECALCGSKAINSIDTPFDTGHSLPVNAAKERPS